MNERSQMATQATEVELAVERLRRVDSHEARELVYGNRPEYQEGEPQHLNWEWQFEQYVTDLGTVADAYLRETDTTLVDSDWLLSICEQEADDMSGEPHYFLSGYHTDATQLIVSPTEGGYVLRADPHQWNNPTRGQVFTICRCFGVTMKGLS